MSFYVEQSVDFYSKSVASLCIDKLQAIMVGEYLEITSKISKANGLRFFDQQIILLNILINIVK